MLPIGQILSDFSDFVTLCQMIRQFIPKVRFIKITLLIINVVQTAEIAPLKRKCTEYQCTSIVTVTLFLTNVSVIKNPANLPHFPLLSKLAKPLLIFFHSYIDSERLFSQYNLSKTKHRNRLSTKIMNALLCIKTNIKSDCYKFSLTKSFLKASRNSIALLKDTS